MSKTETLNLPVLPLRNGVVFPHMVVTVSIESADARRALAAAESTGGTLLLVPQLDGTFSSVGTVAQVQEVSEDGGAAVLLAGTARAVIQAGTAQAGDVLWVEARPVADTTTDRPELDKLADEYRAVVGEILEYRGIGRLAERMLGIDEPSRLADLAVYSPDVTLAQKVELLETVDVEERLTKVLGWMREILAGLSLRQKVRDEAADRIDRSQREYLLRQQLEAIKRELGDGDDDVVGRYRRTLSEASLPPGIAETVAREVDRLEQTSQQSPEHGWIRTWLDTIFEVPWSATTEDDLDLQAARAVLDSDHTGLNDVKDRIVEHLAVRKLRIERGLDASPEERRGSGAILLLVGPPGVGKTSLGESIARALGRRFVRVALGGIRDEAEVRGHRRTYVGARPGRIARALIEAGSMNPVFLLDEMDKVGADWRGDPSSALLEVLDPAQNHTFRDHYLEIDLDLSRVLFVATANVVETIPAPLLDRTEVIRLDGYADHEKIEIARLHLLPRQVRHAGLELEEVSVTTEALREIVHGYTMEAGVRGLERQLGKLVRKVVTKVAGDPESVPIAVDTADVRELLGKRTVYRDETLERTATPGVATGLAVTGSGGDVLFVEAGEMEGEATLTLTGQLGDVMRESAHIALSYVRSHAAELGIDPKRLQQRFHLHVPAGAVPKDGPSAGITMTAALVGLLTGRTVRPTVGMTGEMTLRGRVLPVGGVKQKVLAAHRVGLREIILPKRNEDDLDEIPEPMRGGLTFHLVETIAQALEAALSPAEERRVA